jgi:hypothetical protein
MNNVVQFPKEKIPGLPQTPEEIYEKIKETQTVYINEVVDMYGKNLLHAISQDGFDLVEKDFIRDFAFTLETIRSSLYRSAGIDHPLQHPIDDCMNNCNFGDFEELFSSSMVYQGEDD